MSLVAKNLCLPGRLSLCDLTVEPGERVALIGPNGSGKTSLLRGLAGVDGDADILQVGEEDLHSAPAARRARLVGYLPTSRKLDWPIPVRDLLTLSPAPPKQGYVQNAIERLDLAPFLDRPVNALSTGERARALIARVIAQAPRHLLLDEPHANLDPYWVLTLRELLAEAAEESGLVVALHDLAQIDAFDRLILMRQGAIVADGPRDEIQRGEQIADLFDLKRAPDGSLRL